jgi:hypothetical protein
MSTACASQLTRRSTIRTIPCPIMMSLAHYLLPALNTRRCNGVEFSTVLANLMVLDAEY